MRSARVEDMATSAARTTLAPMDPTTDVLWAWLTQVVIPVLGVASSAAVAIVAIVIANRERSRAAALEARIARSEAATVFRAWIKARLSPGREGPDDEGMLRAGARFPETRRIVEWLHASYEFASRFLRPPGHRGVWIVRMPAKYETVALGRVDSWEGRGTFDYSALTSEDLKGSE